MSTSASARVAAARAILDGAVKAVELQDMAARLEALEEHQSKCGRGERSRSAVPGRNY